MTDRGPQGIAGAIARQINTGELAPGDRLPTVRDVAAELGVSPATVSGAWQALRRAGLVDSRGRAGSFVRAAPRPWLSPRVQGLVGYVEGTALDLSRGTPDPALLPALAPALARVRPTAGTDVYQEAPVVPELLATLQALWPYVAETITVVNGAQDAVALTLEQVVGFGDRVAIENPVFPPFLDMLELLGAEIVPLELDAEGVTVASLGRALKKRPVAVVLQPRAQNPTGVSMTAQRAEDLARALRRTRSDAVVIEDDHSGAISVGPDVSLGTWIPDQVVHVRGFSKSHGPDLRIAALGGPARIVDRLVARRMLGSGWTSRMLQTILLDLLVEPRAVAAVGRARATYAERQAAVVAGLADHGIDLAVPDGINLWLPVADQRAALVQLSTEGIRAAGGDPFLVAGLDVDHVRVTTGLVDTGSASQVAVALAAAARAGAVPYEP
ncbi:MAG TPA: aminotransferase class I/II-fold pyridoxal phosphate-dependent enzyme [Marmoricola sp.]|nr:aminotransferase class I/II-fold pyridoxal phosphate-dependent enzyme [Marmoricola sp.]